MREFLRKAAIVFSVICFALLIFFLVKGAPASRPAVQAYNTEGEEPPTEEDWDNFYKGAAEVAAILSTCEKDEDCTFVSLTDCSCDNVAINRANIDVFFKALPRQTIPCSISNTKCEQVAPKCVKKFCVQPTLEKKP